MPEVKVRNLVLLVVIVGGGILAFVFFGATITYWFWDTWAKARGYTAASTPGEAMDKFREAIHNRDYDAASRYCTKPYAELLKKSHTNAKELATLTDKIRNWGKNNGLMTDRLKFSLQNFDPFPTNFEGGPAPKEEGAKATATYKWTAPFVLDNPNDKKLADDLKTLDPRMFQNILCLQAFNGQIKLVKEGDEWKLDIPTTPLWETEVAYFNDRAKTYETGLNGMWKDLNNQRYDTKAAFERDVIGKLAAAK